MAFCQGRYPRDGLVGEDVTENLRTIKSIPMLLPQRLPSLIVRGEVFMPRTVFAKLNEEREQNGESLWQIPATPLRVRSSNWTLNRSGPPFGHCPFNIQYMEGRSFQTHSETLDFLEQMKFKVIPRKNLSDDT